MTSKKASGKDKALPVHKKENGGNRIAEPRGKRGKLSEKKEAPIHGKSDRKGQKMKKEKAGSRQDSRQKGAARAGSAAPTEKRLRKIAYAQNAGRKKAIPGAVVKVIPLGGLGEIGKNMTAVECGDDIIVVDCGMGFPDDGMLGVDLVIPDTAYLEKNADRVRAIFVTHGHEDHIGAIPYVLRKLNVPIYGTPLTLGIVENKLAESDLPQKADLRVIAAKSAVTAGVFQVEFIPVNHSIPDAVAFAVHSPCGTLVFTGDFKIDSTPIDGEMTDLTRFGELGQEGVTALFCDSTNCERPGFTPSERTVGTSLEQIFFDNRKRVIVATFSSNVHRVQQIIDASVKHERAVCILGRSMINIVTTAQKLGYMKIPEHTLIEPEEIRKFAPNRVTLITTGSQGESMSALTRMAMGTHPSVKLTPEDMVVISAHPIPGNEKTINNIINELTRKKISVVYDQIAEVHVSGHACQEEIKMIFALTKPRFFMPVHGEYKHLVRNAALAEYAGMPRDRIFISEIGRILEISDGGETARLTGAVPAGKILVDGLGVGDVGSVVLRDRKLLSEEGIITVAAAVDRAAGDLVSDVQILSRGFVFVKENEELMDEIQNVARRALESALYAGTDLVTVGNRVRDEVSRFLSNKTRRRPMVVPAIVEI